MKVEEIQGKEKAESEYKGKTEYVATGNINIYLQYQNFPLYIRYIIMYVSSYMYMFTYISISSYMNIFTYICISSYIYIFTYICISSYMYVDMYDVCMYCRWNVEIMSLIYNPEFSR